MACCSYHLFLDSKTGVWANKSHTKKVKMRFGTEQQKNHIIEKLWQAAAVKILRVIKIGCQEKHTETNVQIVLFLSSTF